MNADGLKNMFKGASAFDKGIFTVNTDTALTNVNDLTSMFENALAFNQNINSAATPVWKVEKVTIFTNMFKGAAAFNRDISDWAINGATTAANLALMFNGATAFQQ